MPSYSCREREERVLEVSVCLVLHHWRVDSCRNERLRRLTKDRDLWLVFRFVDKTEEQRWRREERGRIVSLLRDKQSLQCNPFQRWNLRFPELWLYSSPDSDWRLSSSDLPLLSFERESKAKKRARVHARDHRPTIVERLQWLTTRSAPRRAHDSCLHHRRDSSLSNASQSTTADWLA